MSIRNALRPEWRLPCIYILMANLDILQAQAPFMGGGSLLNDPFLDAASPNGAPSPKPAKPEPRCMSQGDIAGAVVATLILSSYAIFLTWLFYLRPKFSGLCS